MHTQTSKHMFLKIFPLILPLLKKAYRAGTFGIVDHFIWFIDRFKYKNTNIKKQTKTNNRNKTKKGRKRNNNTFIVLIVKKQQQKTPNKHGKYYMNAK